VGFFFFTASETFHQLILQAIPGKAAVTVSIPATVQKLFRNSTSFIINVGRMPYFFFKSGKTSFLLVSFALMAVRHLISPLP